MKYLLFFTLIIGLLLSCKNESVIPSVSHTFIKILKPPGMKEFSFTAKPFIKGNTKHLYWYNESVNTISILDLKTGNLSDEIMINSNRKKGMNRLYGFTIKSPDSIYLNTNIPGEISLINTSGEFIGALNYKTRNEIDQINNYVLLNSRVSTDIYFLKGNTYVPLMTPFFEEEPPESYWKSFNIFQGSDQFSSDCSIKLPKLLTNEEGYAVRNYLQSTTLRDTIFFSFQSDHEIYKITDCRIIERKIVKSENASKIYGLREAVSPDNQNCISFRYGNMYGDPYKNLIYRIALHPDYDVDFSCFDKGIFPNKFSIMVMDPCLNLLSETIIDGKKYNVIASFVDENGLNLLRSPEHPEYEKDYLIYDPFDYSDES